MEKVTFPRTGLTLSPLGMGTVPMVAGRLPPEGAVPTLRAVYNLGINWFDTSRLYGPAEDTLGEAFHGMRDQVVIMTKSGAVQPEALRQSLEASLRALQSDYVDVYSFHTTHAIEQECFLGPGGLWDVVEHAREAGQVRYLGFSAHSVELALKAMDVAAFDFAMVPANFISTQYLEGPFMARARAGGVTVLAMKPFGGGRIQNPGLRLRYLRQFPDVLPCIGVESGAQTAENIRIWERAPGPLTPDEHAEMDRIHAELGDRFCHQCGYCEPCPQGVPIMDMNLMEAWVRQCTPQTLTLVLGWAVKKAGDCVGCRECVAKCPYDLPIPDMLKEYVALYERTVAG
jgi:predicted aldo/keto reductase-like oxidoreductase